MIRNNIYGLNYYNLYKEYKLTHDENEINLIKNQNKPKMKWLILLFINKMKKMDQKLIKIIKRIIINIFHLIKIIIS